MNSKKINKNKKFRKGVSLIEALVAVFVFSVVTVSFYSVFSVGTKYILSSKNKIIAIALANERMELLRNLPYDSVALVGGIPSGPIDPDEIITVEGRSFHVLTNIFFYDDIDDGYFNGTPNDVVPNDYKFAKVTVAWGQESASEKATLSSRFVPPGVESSVNGGTFSINAIDYAGNPVANVSVNIFNDQLSPTINYNTQTGVNGNLLLQGVPADAVQNYKITLSKSGYESVTTYPPTGAGFSPSDVHANIIQGALNEKTIVIDLFADLVLKTQDPFGNNIANVSFDMLGGRRLDDGSIEPVKYTYDDNVTTNSSGEFSEENVSPGKFMLSDFSFASGSYQFQKIELGDDLVSSNFNLVPGVDLETKIFFMDTELDSAYILVKDTTADTVIAGASVKLTNSTLGYDVTLTTDKYGYVYFPESESALLQNGETYDLEVSAANYNNETDTVTINKLTNKTIGLTAI